ncbi:MAG TPA: PQQ-binding-like beta-propeller repeat protein [Amycolatopsis sp.]|nr:PQQ-binding-like beta-propeller repeat protein [Amycolatopsis sp.]
MSKSAVQKRPGKPVTRNARKRRPIVLERVASAPVLALRGGAVVLLIALLVAPWLPWQQHEAGWEMLSTKGFAELAVAVVFGLAAAAAWVTTFAQRSRWAGTVAVIITAIGTAAVLTGALAGGPGWPGLGLGLAVVAFPALLVLAIPLTLTSDRRLPRKFGVAKAGAVLAAVVLAVAVVGYGGNWYANRTLTSTTASASPVAAPSGPAGKLLWTLSAGADAAAVTLPGGLVALQHVPGADISVRDTATGAERWHYSRGGASLSDLVLSDDGSTLVAVYRVQDTVAIGFDPGTGTVRWQQSFGGTVLPLPGALVHLDGAQITAYDPDSGRSLWHRSLGQAFCGNTGSIAAGAGLLVALAPCVSVPPAKTGDVVAVDATGHVRWTAPTQAQAQDSSSAQVAVVSHDAVVANLASAMQTLVLDPATGHVRWAADTSTETVQAVGDGIALTAANGRIILRDVITGTLAATQPPGDPVPAGASVASATISNHRAYVLLAGDHPRLAVADTSTGRSIGTYPLPGTASSGTVQAAGGAAVVTTQAGSTTTITAITG